MKNKKNKVYHCNGNFFWITKTDKTLSGEWIERKSGDNMLDQNVRVKKFRIRLEKETKHCLKLWGEDFTIYFYQDGVPCYFEPVTIEILNKEIKDCEAWGVSSQYYKNLRVFTWGNK